MRHHLTTLLLLAMTICPAYCQLERHHAVSSEATGGRYEIIQSPLVRRCTFRIDKYTGWVDQLVGTTDNNFSWQHVPTLTYDGDDSPKTKINYVLFMGGHMAKDCFLMNINNGYTWVLTSYEDKNLAFCPFDYQEQHGLSDGK